MHGRQELRKAVGTSNRVGLGWSKIWELGGVGKGEEMGKTWVVQVSKRN